jgi:hypothetical protein
VGFGLSHSWVPKKIAEDVFFLEPRLIFVEGANTDDIFDLLVSQVFHLGAIWLF